MAVHFASLLSLCSIEKILQNCENSRKIPIWLYTLHLCFHCVLWKRFDKIVKICGKFQYGCTLCILAFIVFYYKDFTKL